MGRGRRAMVAVVALVASAAAVIVAPGARAGAPVTLPLRWRFVRATLMNQPALVGNRVVITTDNTATAVGLAQGNALWRVVHPDQAGVHTTIGQPTLANGFVDAPLDAGGLGGTVDYDPADGSYTVNGPYVHEFFGPLVVDAALTARVEGVFGSGTGPVNLFDFGGRTWFLGFGASGIGLPSISGGRAFVTQDGTIAMFDPAAPCVLLPIPSPPPWCLPTWRVGVGVNSYPVSYAGPGRVAVGFGGGPAWSEYDAATGNVLWTYAANTGRYAGAMAWSNGRLYAGAADNLLRVFDAITGRLLWTGDVGQPVFWQPTIANGKVYIAGNAGRVAVFNAAGCGAATCSPIAIAQVPTGADSSPRGPVLVRNGIAVVAFTNTVAAFTTG